uniref:DAZ-associated protein 1 n=1 Tax=Salmo salar TaxID=8030 RepID=B5X891_SALSA|nr:DAZ-associated protein 1 [Salmo salar]
MYNFIPCLQIDPKPCTPRGMQPEKVRTKDGWVRGVF